MTRPVRRFTVFPRLPERLEALLPLARNLAWTWDPEIAAVLADVDPDGFERSQGNPLVTIAGTSVARLEQLAGDDDYCARVAAAVERLTSICTAAGAFDGRTEMPRTIAYFSPEFGVSAVLPQYSGGLGVLAGDHLKAAHDLGVPLVGVGLFYHQGYFRQVLTAAGRQLEEYDELDPGLLPLVPALTPQGEHARVEIPMPGASLHAAVWRAQIGRIPLFLLDSDVPENVPELRPVTDRLYGGDRLHRLRQEVLLGVGGVRALARLGIEAEVFHTNEGHAGFLGLERIRVLVQERGLALDAAIEAVRAGTAFTTHTPVPAGIDRFHRELIEHVFGEGGVPTGMEIEELLALGDERDGDPAQFNMAMMGIRLAGHVNGVSRLHGEVSRRMFRSLWPGFALDDVPIRHITNGVHAESWVGPELDRVLRNRLGDGYGAQGHGWRALREVGDDELWDARRGARRRLVEDVRGRVRRQWEARGLRGDQLAWVEGVLDPEALTVGFARRVPTYKRLTLMLSDRERLTRLLTDAQRPLQIVVAGKAHPADEEGKALLAELGSFAARAEVRHRLVVLADYDMALARSLVTGVDVWLNTPLRPFEACGTSGMKAALNGALNLSVLDGWWDELYDGDNGFAIPSVEERGHGGGDRDAIEGQGLLDELEHVVLSRFYDRPDGVPRAWLGMVRHTLADTAPRLLASRMMRDYVEDVYVPAAALARRLCRDEFAAARALAEWKRHVRERWPAVRIEGVEASHDGRGAGEPLPVRAWVRLGELSPADVTVEALVGRPANGSLHGRVVGRLEPVAHHDGVCGYAGEIVLPAGPLGLLVRVLPAHADLVESADLRLVVTDH